MDGLIIAIMELPPFLPPLVLLSPCFSFPLFSHFRDTDWMMAGSHEVPSSQSGQGGDPGSEQDLTGRVAEHGHGHLTGES